MATKIPFFVLLTLLFWLPVWGNLASATITRVTAISFGKFVLKNNTAQRTMRVTRSNGVTSNAAFIRIVNPNRGQYTLTGFPPSTVLTFTIPNTTLSLNGSGTGEIFDVITFTPPASLTTNSNGRATLNFGATLRTSGSGTMYPDGNYSGLVDITVNY